MDAKTLAENLDRVQGHLQYRVAENARLREALRALVAGGQPVVEDDGEYFCWFCDKQAPGPMQPLAHESDCPWVAGRALLAMPSH